MEVLGIIGRYILLTVFVIVGFVIMGFKYNNPIVKPLGVVIILWLVLNDALNSTDHKGLYITCDILSGLVVFFALSLKNKLEVEEQREEQRLEKQRYTPLVISDCTVGEGDCFGQLNRQIIISESVQSIGANVLNECDEVESLEIPASVGSIGPEFCFHCKMLRKVSFLGSCPEGLEQAFDECWHLKEITVPAAEVEKYRTAMPKYIDIISKSL